MYLTVVFTHRFYTIQSRIQTLNFEGVGGGGGGHEMRLNTKRTVGSFGGRILIYNKIITRKI